jgi:hypothetical protein
LTIKLPRRWLIVVARPSDCGNHQTAKEELDRDRQKIVSLRRRFIVTD